MQKRAVIMIVDGLRADLVTPDFMPVLSALGEQSQVFTNQRSVFPSATRVNSASIATGCLPATHGLAGNTIALDEGNGLQPVSVGPVTFRERWRRATGRTLACATMSERLRETGGAVIYTNSSPGAAHMQDPDGHGWLHHRTGSHGPGFEPLTSPLDGILYDASGDDLTVEHFCAALRKPEDSKLFLTWICEPDHSQHVLELGSPAHREVLIGADVRVGQVASAVSSLRAQGEDILFIIGSDHGHETVESVVPVTELLVEAGFKAAIDSHDVVFAGSGMGALIYLSEAALPLETVIASWLRSQPWCGEVFVGDELTEIDQCANVNLRIGFAMAKRDEPNRYGIRGIGPVAGDPFYNEEQVGFGQHGGLGMYETNATLIVSGGGFSVGRCGTRTSTTDIAPTVLHHLGVAASGMDGRVLQFIFDDGTSPI